MVLGFSSLKLPAYSLGASALLLLCAATLPPFSLHEPVDVSPIPPDCVGNPGNCVPDAICGPLTLSYCVNVAAGEGLPPAPFFTCTDANGDDCWCCWHY